MATVHDFSVKKTDGTDVLLETYKGNVLLIVNTATECGFAEQFNGLEKLYQDYGTHGFYVLGFPCNQFGNQEPVTDGDMENVCRANFGVTFPLFAKINVNGPDADPLYKFLKKAHSGILSATIKWNFTKFLVDPNGHVTDRFSPTTEPQKIDAVIRQLLNK